MKRVRSIYVILQRIALSVLVCAVFVGCPSEPTGEVGSDEQMEEPVALPEPEPVDEPVQEPEEGITPPEEGSIPPEEEVLPSEDGSIPIAGAGYSEEPENKELEKYMVRLESSDSIELHEVGILKVTVGQKQYLNLEKKVEGMVRDTNTIYAYAGAYARITPHAPDFKIEPEGSKVVRVVPTGTDVMFTLVPERKGTFQISAEIELFDNEECTGVGIPQSAEILSVLVTVDHGKDIESGAGQLWSVFWDHFVKFWGAFVAVIFGALIFVVRKFVKKKTGYSEDGSTKEEPEE